jgi:hypothetical protein
MTTNVNNSNRLDGIDAERFRQMIESESFALLRKRIQQMFDTAARRCIEETDLPTLHANQGAAHCLRTILGLPEQLLGEIRSNNKA